MSQAWGILAAVFIITMPLLYEAWDIHKAIRNTRESDHTKQTLPDHSIPTHLANRNGDVQYVPAGEPDSYMKNAHQNGSTTVNQIYMI